ncbi:ABC transporter C family member 8-like [Dioscorea cayenensis subsp. rotundata]|uniref:ABC transporter C family member 8-like n=1 Tax=Dioscorea cayennensis subsp. rotundata TaxID=55577 RepID=A0AB40ARA6_DIOCR|nr:ABC transporter C family member 8-like [Dioscorea cayenensis subsp. rotundata]
MFSLKNFQELFTWLCEGEFELGSSCVQRSMFDSLNLLFLLSFLLALLYVFRKRNNIHGRRSRGCVYVFGSILCAIASIIYFIACLLVKFKGNNKLLHQNWVNFAIRSIVWIGLAASLQLLINKFIKVLVLAWWVCFSVLESVIVAEMLFGGQSIQILDISSWPICLLLLYCAFDLARGDSHQNSSGADLDQHLLFEEAKVKTELEKAGFLSMMTFSWINPLLNLGYLKPLVLEDIPSLSSDDSAFVAANIFLCKWGNINKEKRSFTSNLIIRALARCYLKEMIQVGVYALLRTIAVVSLPLLVRAFVHLSSNEGKDTYQGVLLVVCLILVKLVESFSQRHWFFNSRRYGMRMRSALMAVVFEKQFKLSCIARRRHSMGQIVNYIAVDAYRLGELLWWFNMAWSLPLQLLLGIAVLFSSVGIGLLLGLVPLVLFGLANIPFAKRLQICQTHVVNAQDERIRATTEILNNMKIIKLQSWEDKFKNVIESIREVEFKWMKEAHIKKAYGSAFYWMSPTFISSLVFVGCSLMKSAPLDASTVFTVLATLRVMAEPTKMFAEVISMIIQAKVSMDRLNAFLQEDEFKHYDVVRISEGNSDASIRIHADFSWEENSTVLTLEKINLFVNRAEKVAMCGPVGSGKSSLLLAILGEIPKTSGLVESLWLDAYVSQTSWIQSGTIRDNVLFGKAMDNTKYQMTIKACALDKDIDSFEYGDLTEIGQRGLNLSGGQKQRIQLARAVYSDADIYLLDDPFSAVDSHTASYLFEKCINGALEKKTVILVTHQIDFLTETNKIMVMKDGKITQSGSYEELLKSGTVFEQLVNAHQSAMKELSTGNHVRKGKNQQTLSAHSNEKIHNVSNKALPKVQLTQEEEMETGNSRWKPYLDYVLIPKSSFLFAMVVFFQSLFIILQAISTFWLAFVTQLPKISDGMLIGIYSAFSILSAFAAFMRSLFGAHLALKASKAFFFGLLESIFKAPMQFFDSTPMGRILTRASSDMSVMDFQVPYSLVFTLVSAIEVIGTVTVMATVTWQVLIIAIPITFAAGQVQTYYLASARKLVRINGTTKAPLTNYAAETSNGVVTIKAFSMIQWFIENNLKLIDTDATMFFHTIASMEWALLRVEALQNLTIFTSAILFVLLPQGTITPGLVGLALSYALTLTTSQVYLTRWYCNLDNHIISVERIIQYMHISSEPPAILESNRPPFSWPSKGRIDLQDLQIKYRLNAPLVLKGITCTFPAGHKIGVVGRTGSGKTTLISALFRLVDPAGGRILIDGLDICTIGLKDLRLKLSIIPQEPTLFKGSIRSNLDPLGQYDDREIWEAIRKCQLEPVIRSLPALLDSSVSDDGENWSVGQRQLFCLGRVLLRRNKILVLDEATASIDSATDNIIQQVINQEFSGCTVITIAHRVPTVIDSQMVMLLSYGEVVEYDKPSTLMQCDSSFSKLVAEYWFNHKRNVV